MTPGSLAHVTPGEFSSAVIDAVRAAVVDGDFAVPVPMDAEDVSVEVTGAGDFATPLPLRLAKAAGRPAPEVASVLATRLSRHVRVASARVTGPGFLTVTVDAPITARIDESYGLAPVPSYGVPVPSATWPTRPMTFDNPGFRVRFAYARACGVRRHAADLGIPETGAPETGAPETRAPETRAPETRAPETRAPETRAPETRGTESGRAEASSPEPGISEPGISESGSLEGAPLDHHLADPRERRLLALLAEFPVRAEQARRRNDPRPFARHLESVADAYHDVHERCPALPKGDEPVGERHLARLGLARAARIVLGNGLRMLGETPADRL